MSTRKRKKKKKKKSKQQHAAVLFDKVQIRPTVDVADLIDGGMWTLISVKVKNKQPCSFPINSFAFNKMIGFDLYPSK
jgi:hypothetical protein